MYVHCDAICYLCRCMISTQFYFPRPEHQHKLSYVMMASLSSLVAPEFGVVTVAGVGNDNKVSLMIT